MLVTGLDNKVTFINTSAERILNLPASHILGQTLDIFGGLFGKAASTWMQTIRGWSENSENYQPGDTYAEQIELDNKRIVLVHLAPVMLQNEFLGTVSIFRDITHEVEVDRLKSEFVATVSHELRTPMTSIKGYTDILLMGAAGALNENQSHFLQIIKSNTERLNILVNDLLDISRIEAGTGDPGAAGPGHARGGRGGGERFLRRFAEGKQAHDDRGRIAQGIAAWYSATWSASGRSSTTWWTMPITTPRRMGRSRCTCMSEGREVQVDVSDSGIGIAPEDQERVFERFYRGEHPLVLATPGTGLGLSIVKQLVEMHNGRIWMKSKGIPGQGSTFSFTLPVNQPAERGNNGKDFDR